MKYYLAIDLGASSGRHIIGYFDKGEIKLEEIYRFKTGMDDSSDGLVWDISRLYKEILKGIKFAFKKYPHIESLAIDTWGVDYVLLDEHDKEITPFYAYRNSRNEISSKEVHDIISFNDLYNKSGIQFASFNTIYQLFDDLKKKRLENAKDYLMLPSYFTYKLTGIKTHEYTNESTTGLLNASNKDYDQEIIDKLGLPKHLFAHIDEPGMVVGELLPEIQNKVKGNCKVILCASHDTASAFEAVEATDKDIILSSGTWSLLGIKSKKPIISEKSLKVNYTNEGGVNYIRFLKNIMGMWVANKLREECCYTQEFVDNHMPVVSYDSYFDINDPSLLAPKSMREAVSNLLKDNPPKSNLELFKATYHSLAISYKKAIEELEEITNQKYQRLIVVGGGAKNACLNQYIKRYINKEIVSLPIEATSLGNIKIQMKASKKL